MAKLKSVYNYIKDRFARFLLLALLLTTVISTQTVAQAKYSSYLTDYTSAIAGDFFFTSNFLSEEGTEYSISSWDGQNYSLPIEIRNYENAYRYNKAGTDVYYYVTATIEHEDGTGGRVPSTVFGTPTVTLGTNDANYVADYAPVEGGAKYRCACLPGMGTYDRKVGTQNVTVSVHANSIVQATQYLTIEVRSIPISEARSTKIERKDGKMYPTTKGVYETVLKTEITLHASAQNVDYEQDLFVDPSTYEVNYTITCKDITGGAGSSTFYIYYDSNKLEYDTSNSTLLPQPEGSVAIEERPEVKYVTKTINARSVNTIQFFRKTMGTEIDEPDTKRDLWCLPEYEIEDPGGGEGTGTEENTGGSGDSGET